MCFIPFVGACQVCNIRETGHEDVDAYVKHTKSDKERWHCEVIEDGNNTFSNPAKHIHCVA